LPRLFFVHLLEIGHLLVFHKILLPSWGQDLVPTFTIMLPSIEVPCIRRRLGQGCYAPALVRYSYGPHVCTRFFFPVHLSSPF
jgi:hypothetical protein